MSDAVESGLGLPEVVRAAARALDASLVLIDRSSSVLAVAARSSADERALMTNAAGVSVHELRVGDAVVGKLRLRGRAGEPPPAFLRVVTTMIASEVERLRAPDRASEAAQAAFLTAVMRRDVTDRARPRRARRRAGARPRRRRRRRGRARAPLRPGRGRLAQPRAGRRRARGALERARVAGRRARRARRGRRRPPARHRGRHRAPRGRGGGARAGRRAARLHLRGRPLARRPRPGRPLPRRRTRRCWPPTSPRRGRSRAPARSRSRTPAPTGCCCPP